MKSFNTFFGTVLSCTLLLAAGCASPAQPQDMVPKQFSVVKKHPSTVAVPSLGGNQSDPMLHSQVSHEAFTAAVQESLSQAGVFKQVVPGPNSDYTLEVVILKLDHPMAGLTITVSMSTSWKLTKTGTGEVVFEDLIHKEFVATMGDAFVGVTRARLADEGVARETIAEGIHRLSQADF